MNTAPSRPTNDTHNTIYDIATWVWGAGSDFISPDGKRTEINSPEARRGASDYFNLFRFMPPHNKPFTDASVLELFFARKAASIVAGPWLLNSLRIQKSAELAQLLPMLGATLLPGPSFIGGTLLVSWKHNRYPSESMELIRRLTSAEFQGEYCHISGLLPVRQNLWDNQFITSNEYLPTFNQALQTGRGLPPIALWGMIEDRLSKTISAIWQDIYTANKSEKAVDGLDKIIARHFEHFATRLDTTLSSSDH